MDHVRRQEQKEHPELKRLRNVTAATLGSAIAKLVLPRFGAQCPAPWSLPVLDTTMGPD